MELYNEEELDYYPDLIEQSYEFKIAKNQTSERIDSFLTRQIVNATRTRIQKAIDMDFVTINGKAAKSSKKIQGGDLVVCKLLKSPPIELIPQNIPFEVIYEDEYLLVVNKPAGMCTHPGVGNRYGTLVNALIYHLGQRESIKVEFDDDEDEQNLGMVYASDSIRPGIVHRLDKDTSGLLLIAKSPEIHVELQKQFYDRTISRIYNALVWGHLKEAEGTIEGDIGRSPTNRKKFAVVKRGGKHAITDYKLVAQYDYASLLSIKLRTGRTHQIRVHFSNLGHSVFGDKLYGGDKATGIGTHHLYRSQSSFALTLVNRQMLHAKEITFRHPVSKEIMNFSSSLPEDFLQIIEIFNK